MVELGAGMAVATVRQFSHAVLEQLQGRLVRINPRDAAVPSRLEVSLPVGALSALQALDARLQGAGWRTAEA